MDSTEMKEQRAAAILSDSRWVAIVARNREADHTFYYSVDTTGIYCMPSCAARLARPEHVRFHATPHDAEQAGFRPCKRCRPNQPSLLEEQTTKVVMACRIIEQSEQTPNTHEIALQVGMSHSHFHRTFQQIMGLTPKAYAMAQRENRIRNQLSTGTPVTEAIFNAGYQTSSRFYEKSSRVLGMTPSRYKAGGAGNQIRFAIGECSLGAILVAQSNVGICAIALGDDPVALVSDLQDRFPHAELIGGDAAFENLVAQVIGFIEMPGIPLNLPLDIRGTAFQQKVWQALRDIPAGHIVSYTEIAQRIGLPKAIRAVATACAANALAVAIPCHRVVRNDGSLSGYRWGVERKRALLESEAKLQSDQKRHP
jgi:AraC family transcriptional regulator of adaptative response/methylated-DNA-[protein]-cysteine methyltransferase